MKVIDLLNKMANGEKVPKIVRVLDMSLFPEYQIITWNENLKLYEYCDGCEFDRILDKHHLEKYVEIIEDKPEEDTQKVLLEGYPLKGEDMIVSILPDPIEIEKDGINYFIRNEHGTKCYLTTNNRIIIEKLNQVINCLERQRLWKR